MNTRYLNMSKKTANQLLIISSIFGSEEYRESTIIFSFTKGNPDYPEPVLNLKWSLSGECKMIKSDFHEKPEGIVKYLLRLSKDTSPTGRMANNLWDSPYTQSFNVSGKDLKNGINNLFLKLTEEKELEGTGLYIPIIFLWKKEPDDFVKVLYFSKEENRFNRIFYLLPYLCEIERQLQK